MGTARHRLVRRARSTESTLAYVHLSGRDLAEKLNRGMRQIHSWRVDMLTRTKAVSLYADLRSTPGRNWWRSVVRKASLTGVTVVSVERHWGPGKWTGE